MTATKVEQRQGQCMTALDKANEHRYAQAEFKKALNAMAPRDAQARLADMLEGDLPPEIEAAHIFQVLTACPKVGEVKARRALRRVGVPEHKRLRQMTPRQRSLLAAEIRRVHEGGAW